MFFYDYINQQLNNDPESSYTRIMVILLQNQGPADFFQSNHEFNQFKSFPQLTYSEPGKILISNLIKIFFSETWQGLKGFSLINEIQWLKHRLK